MEVPRVETPQESLDRMRLEVAELRASRERVLVAADAERRQFEHDLHDGPQQHLVALAANLQLARALADTDPDAAKALLDEMSRDVQQALAETAELAHRIYPPLLDAGGLATALRAAAVALRVPAQVDVATTAEYTDEVASAVYFCCLDALGRAGDGARATITVRDDDGVIDFAVAVDSSSTNTGDDALCDRVEALGGRLTIETTLDGGTRVAGSLPLSR